MTDKTLLASFNTGRHYGPDKQPIDVYLIESGEDWAGSYMVVEFHDKARMIKGQTMLFNGMSRIEQEVMEAYDKNTYKLV